MSAKCQHLLRVHLPFADSGSETLAARDIAGGEGGDPRLRGEGEVGLRRSHRKYLVLIGHHLTYPLLRNGSLPLPRFAAERTLSEL